LIEHISVALALLHAGEMTPLQPLRAAMRVPKLMANGFKVRPAAWLLTLAQLDCHLHTQLHAARYLRAPRTLHFRCLRTRGAGHSCSIIKHSACQRVCCTDPNDSMLQGKRQWAAGH
jgi:hypothetical protein